MTSFSLSLTFIITFEYLAESDWKRYFCDTTKIKEKMTIVDFAGECSYFRFSYLSRSDFSHA